MSTETVQPPGVEAVFHVVSSTQFIPLSDGVRLACHLWLPHQRREEDGDDNLEAVPSPAILEYLPYWGSVWTARRDEPRHGYFCQAGYACVRVDMRGSGDSEGVYYDEYAPQEQSDALEVLTWISAQPWYNGGGIGMYGKSWGGFNGLQVAACRHPDLKCVISLYSTDDRYADDVHYIGGAVLGSWMLAWSTFMFGWNARPPNPLVTDLHPPSKKSWWDMWRSRLKEASAPWVTRWLQEQTRDGYWCHGSVCEDTYSRIECPVYLIGGWVDGYTNPVFRMMERLTCPRKGLIGPWSHDWPDSALPGPQIGYLQECVRWWDAHLKGVKNGIMEEPPLAIYLREPLAPQPQVTEWPGNWVFAQVPTTATTTTTTTSQPEISLAFTLAGESLVPQNDVVPDPGSDGNWRVLKAGPIWLGVEAQGSWCSFGGPDLPLDQRLDNALSTCFDSESFQYPYDILGFPELQVVIKAPMDLPTLHLIARLSYILPTGEALLLSKGVLNLSHRRGHRAEDLQPIRAGEEMRVKLWMDAIGHKLEVGGRLVLALSQSYWPLVWPPPVQVDCLVKASAIHSLLRIPLMKPDPRGLQPRFHPATLGPMLPFTQLRGDTMQRKVCYDLVSGSKTLQIDWDDGCFELANDGISYDEKAEEEYIIQLQDPACPSVQCHRDIVMKLPRPPGGPATARQGEDGSGETMEIEIHAKANMTSDENSFTLYHHLKVVLDQQVVWYEQDFHSSIPRIH